MEAAEQGTRRRGRPPLELDEHALLGAAAEVFANDGYFGASVDEIARRAGTSKALLFRRYASKDALFDLTVAHEVRFLTELLFRAYDKADELSVRDGLGVGVEAIIAYAGARPDGFRLLFQTGFTAGQGATPAWEKVRVVVAERISDIVLRKLESVGSPGGVRAARVLASAIVGASEHVARLLVEDEALDAEAAGELLTEFLAFGMTGLRRPALEALEDDTEGRGT
jgi:AcrR family transcriptional regulator